MAEFDAEGCECRQCVDDESTPVAGVVIEYIGVRSLLDSTVHADRVCDALVFALGAGFAEFRVGECIVERIPGKRLLHYAFSSSAS